MKVSRSRFILDTNILIDLYRGNVIDEFFSLPYDFASSDVIIAELKIPSGEELIQKGLQSLELSGKQVEEVAFIWEHNLELSVNDIFALVMTYSNHLPLLTGDRRLRILADKHNVVVHGTLWILDEMINHKVLNKEQASKALQTMLENGSRLPNSECLQRFKAWKRK